MSREASGSVFAVPGGRQDRLEEAAADLRALRSCLLGESDPRETRAYLGAMRSCVTDIAEIARDEADVVLPSPAAGPGEDAVGGNDLLDACGRALGAVDQLLAGIADARRLEARQVGWPPEAFAASRAMIRLLLTDRAAVDASVRQLLQATTAYLGHPPASAPVPGGQRQTSAALGDGPVGTPTTGGTP